VLGDPCFCPSEPPSFELMPLRDLLAPPIPSPISHTHTLPSLQNNLRLFVDGKLVVGGRPDSDDSHSAVYDAQGRIKGERPTDTPEGPSDSVATPRPLFSGNREAFRRHSLSALEGLSPAAARGSDEGPDGRLLKMVCAALKHEGA